MASALLMAFSLAMLAELATSRNPSRPIFSEGTSLVATFTPTSSARAAKDSALPPLIFMESAKARKSLSGESVRRSLSVIPRVAKDAMAFSLPVSALCWACWMAIIPLAKTSWVPPL